jgi:YNFM family putative membrane transporter
MNDKSLWMILGTTVLAFATLYAPQPILPLLAQELAVSHTQAALLITLALLPLGVAPLVYGFLLETIPAQRLLRGATLLVALSEVAFLVSDRFAILATARLIQGLALPALFTAAMTYCSAATRHEEVRKVLGAYVAATILGGFLGRAVTGALADFGHWRLGFWLWTGGLVLAWWGLRGLRQDARVGFARPRPAVIVEVWRVAEFRAGYLFIFAVFFAFASLLNFLPFHLKLLDPQISEATIALSYLGYLVGVVVAVNAPRITDLADGVHRALAAGLVLFAVGALLFLIPWVAAAYASMFVLCAGFFTVHSVLSGHLNQLARTRKGVVNGLYVSCYYTGGALGSVVPGVLLRHFGWNVMVIALLVVIVCAGFALRGIGPGSASP